jgi:hypothetical protein
VIVLVCIAAVLVVAGVLVWASWERPERIERDAWDVTGALRWRGQK